MNSKEVTMKTAFRFCMDCSQFKDCYTDDDISNPGPYLLSPGCFKPCDSSTVDEPDRLLEAKWLKWIEEYTADPLHR